MTFSGVVSRNTSPTTSLLSAVTSLNATGTTLGAPLAQVASVCPVCQEALSDEESAEAPPAAEEARRFRGSVPTAGRGSGWEPADTTVSAEEHAKKITTQMGGDLWSGRRGSNSLPSIPRLADAIRRNPASPLDLTRFAQVEAASLTLPAGKFPKNKRHTFVCLLFLERATRLELATSTLARSRSTR